MIKIREITNDSVKVKVTEEILRGLPEWFGNEASVLEYIEGVKGEKFFVAYDGDYAIGFLCFKVNNQYTADIYVTGVRKEYHRKGIGKDLVEISERHLINSGYVLYMVKTLGESSDYEFYQKTRKFYQSVGFYPLQEFEEIWDENNPCLIMVKSLKYR